MKAVLNAIFLLLFLFEASSVMAMGVQIERAKKVSYSIKASYVSGSVLHINEGMAVAIHADNNKCMLATAKHIVKNASTVSVKPLSKDSADSESISAKVIYTNDLEDLAFLTYETTSKCPVPKLDLDENTLIDKAIFSFKCIKDDNYQVAVGKVTDFKRYSNTGEVMMADMTIENGFTGGGAFDNSGNLAGIISGTNYKRTNAYLVSSPRIVAAFLKLKYSF